MSAPDCGSAIATVMKRLERDGLLVRGVRLPAPREDADPCERQGPYSGLLGLACFAWRLGVPLRPAGRPDRRRPCDARVPEALWTREAPVPPGLLAAARGHRRDPGIFLSCGSGSRACAWFAAGDEPPGAQTGPAPGRAWNKGKSGWRGAMAVSTSARACTGTRRWATSACTRSA